MDETQNKPWWKSLRTETILLAAVLIALVTWIIIDQRSSRIEQVTEPLEVVSGKLDEVIMKREQDKQVLLSHIDSLHAADTIYVKEQTRVINRYYYENNRINNLDDNSQFGLLSKNLAKGAAREQSGYYDVPNSGRGEDSK